MWEGRDIMYFAIMGQECKGRSENDASDDLRWKNQDFANGHL